MTGCLLIVGAGGHGKVVADAALLQGRWSEIAFVDDDPSIDQVLDLPVLGGSGVLEELRPRFTHAVIAVGEASIRLDLLDKVVALKYAVPMVCHPSAVVSPHATIGPSTVLFANCVVNPGCHLGQGCIVNTGAIVDHDCSLGDGVHIAPGAVIAGGVKIGSQSWIGIGACVRQGVTIGPRVIVGAGAAVTTNIAKDQTVVGVPARPLSRVERSTD